MNTTPTCELTHCASRKQNLDLITVHQNVEDGCYNVGICTTCADVLNLKTDNELPYDGRAGQQVNKKLKRALKQLQS